jgi:cell division protein FtsW (lipid II flippase)
MRILQRHPLLRLGAALVIGGAVTFAARLAGTVVASVLLIVTTAVIAFVVLTIAPDAIAHQRGHRWRWWWRASDDDGPFWPGTRIPRNPR